MNGWSVFITGTLNAFVKQKGQSTSDAGPVWSLSGNQGDRWRQAKITIHPVSTFQVCQLHFPCISTVCNHGFVHSLMNNKAIVGLLDADWSITVVSLFFFTLL